ncbi:MAG: hypothetical protein ACREGC_03485, partial [Minisyncoccia bacterium]
ALAQSIDIVREILLVSPTTKGAWSPYQLAVFNLAGHLIVEFAQDVTWSIISASVSSSPPYFATLTLGPAVPVLTPGSAGQLNGTIYVQIAYAYAMQAGAISPEANTPVTGPTGSVSITSPPAAPGATGYYVYASNTSGAEILQSTTPTPIGTPYVLADFGPLTITPPVFSVSPADQAAVSGITPIPYDASLSAPLSVYSVSAPGTQVQITYPLVANRAIGYPQATNPGAATVLPGAVLSQTSFYNLRKGFGLLRFVPGVVTSVSDSGTSTGLLNSEFMRTLQIQDLQYIKTPWGRQYLAMAQRAGPTLWGLT